MGRGIVVLGIFVADATFRADRQPRIGETVLGRSFALSPGGKGSNQAVAAARAGAEVHFITRLGKDAFADMARRVWAEAGVRADVTEDAKSYTGAAGIVVEHDSGNNAIIVAPGAASRITVGDLDARAELVSKAAVFVAQLEQPVEAARRGLEIARAGGATTILNPAPAAPLPDAMLALCDFITPNETEAEALTGIAVAGLGDAERAADVLLSKGVGAVILTLGAAGALYKDRTGSVHVPAVDAGPVVETTGAGDAFNGGFACALAEGRNVLDAVRMGCATGGLSVTRAGAASSMPDRAEIDAIMKLS